MFKVFTVAFPVKVSICAVNTLFQPTEPKRGTNVTSHAVGLFTSLGAIKATS